MENIEVVKLVQYLDCNIDLEHVESVDEYYYSSLPLCVIDSIYSIGAKYESTRNTVMRYCSYFNLPITRKNRDLIPLIEDQESIDLFLRKQKTLGVDKFANDVLGNRQRTSARSGILKAEAVLKFTETLYNFKVSYFQDIPKIISDPNFESNIKRITGQGSGTSFTYFFMLAGSDELIKPDRMILNFLASVLERRVNQYEAQSLLADTSNKLRVKYPHMNPRLLDNKIWEYQREKTG